MVFLSTLSYATPKKSVRPYLRKGFRDTLRIFVSGGIGGNGYPKFGGVGGNGGNVYVVAKEGISLEEVNRSNKSQRYIAANGRHSSHNFILGPPGESLKIEVPVGVTVVTDFGKKLGELNQPGEELLVAKGGTGGHPKNGYLGTKGQNYPVKLDLKLIADIGLVGFPNAGKSTLLKGISDAKPKIASYPFTTVRPNVGIMSYKDLRQISMADLPGLIEGAHANKGMGHKFLKHVERTKLILLVVDINGFQLSPMHPHRSCMETVALLNKELELYNEELLCKPSMIIINKMDTEGAEDKFGKINNYLKNFPEYSQTLSEELRPWRPLKFCDVLPISAQENPNDITLVKDRLRQLLDVMALVNGQEEDKDRANLYNNLKKSLTERGPSLV